MELGDVVQQCNGRNSAGNRAYLRRARSCRLNNRLRVFISIVVPCGPHRRGRLLNSTSLVVSLNLDRDKETRESKHGGGGDCNAYRNSRLTCG